MMKKKTLKTVIYILIGCLVLWFVIFHSLMKTNLAPPVDDKPDVNPWKEEYFAFKVPELPERDIVNQIRDGSGILKVAMEKNDNFWSKIDQFSGKAVYNAMGLTFRNRQFYLNGKPFRVFSGSIHYFRVLRESWKDRLLKLKACGLNTVETYVPWNLHEPHPGVFRFDDMLDLRAFIQLAAELGIYVILRPGPYICSEMDFGGLPGWLLQDDSMRVRSNYKGYLKAVIQYFNVLLPKVKDLQFTEGGPIIMVQVENEYAIYGENTKHLKMLTYLLRTAGIKELLVTSDNDFSDENLLYHDYALPTSNAATFKQDHYDRIMAMNSHFPFMIMELWTGWFSSWGQRYKSGRPIAQVNETLQQVLKVGGSFNLYMFHGGTNFGFSAGAINLTKYSSFVTSYDYDALLTEAGDTTAKYMAVRKVMLEFYKTMGIDRLPPIPPDSPKTAYGRLAMEQKMRWSNIHRTIVPASYPQTVSFMEKYEDSKGHVMSMGYIIYSQTLHESINSNVPGVQLIGFIKDRLLAILSDQLFYVLHGPSTQIDPFLQYNWDKHFKRDHYDYSEGYGYYYDQVFKQPEWMTPLRTELLRVIKNLQTERYNMSRRMDLVVENQGRVSYSTRDLNLLNQQRKGLNGPVFRVLFTAIYRWEVRFLTFDREQCHQFSTSTLWTEMEDKDNESQQTLLAPTLFRTHLNLDREPKDTFIQLQYWTKGVVIVNGFNLGRYWKIGPQQTLYLPRSLLHKGRNEILIFEEEKQGQPILLSADSYL